MPTNLYGPNDNYDLEKSHVLPALIRKMHLGKCLEQGNWKAICEDLNKRPIEGIDGQNKKDEILKILGKYGITSTLTSSSTLTSTSTSVTLWGTGQVFREFLHVNDMADACVHIVENVEGKSLYEDLKQTHINIGTGVDLTIRELAETVKNVVGFEGDLEWDSTKPDGTHKKQLDVNLIHQLNWKAGISLGEGITKVYASYKV
jgi:GDP-L-fucose synthase